MHSQYFATIDGPHIDKKSGLAWLKSSAVKRSTEGTIWTIQENSISTKYIKKHIHKKIEIGTCRACKQNKETIQHFISGFLAAVPAKYIERHANVQKYIYICLAKKCDSLKNVKKRYNYDPEPLLKNDLARILGNVSVHTDRRINHNKTDILGM